MRLLVVAAALGLAALGAGGLRAPAPDEASPAAADAGAPPAIPVCLQVRTESRWVPYGYNHVVILRNGCARPATCVVSSDVNPEPQTAEVPAGQAVEVLTYMAAAASVFTARVGCRLH